jgi:hypothetical protein
MMYTIVKTNLFLFKASTLQLFDAVDQVKVKGKVVPMLN